MIRRLVIVISAVVIGVVSSTVGPSAAHAGGWAVTALDPLPPITPGEPAIVEFTILQHGRTPVFVDGVTIDIRDADGSLESFVAEPGSTEGRYSVSVVFPSSGEYTWQVTQGWFGPQELGTMRIGAADLGSSASSSSSAQWPSGLRYALLASSAGLIAIGGLDLLRNRRRVVAA